MGTFSSGQELPFALGDWVVDPSTGEIRRGAETARLEPRVVEVLLHLVEAEGRVVPKEQLFASVWEGASVTDDVLRRCIYSLRAALGDNSEQPRYIRTLPRRGYQLVARVAPLARAPTAPTNDFLVESRLAAAPIATARSARPVLPVGLAAFAVLLATAIGVSSFSSSPTGALAAAPTDGPLLLADGSPMPSSADELFDLAIDHATQALGLDPERPEANKALGIAFVGKGWLSSAAREYERALQLRPGYLAVINNLAIIEISRGRLDRAVALQLQLDRSTPTRGLYLNNLGHTYRLLGDHNAARRLLEASIEAGPDTSNPTTPTTSLAAIDLAEGNLEAARDRVRATLPSYRNEAPFLAQAGLVELAAGDPARAEELFRRSAQRSAYGTNNLAWLGLAYLHLQRSEPAAAEEIFASFYAHAEESRRLRREHWIPHYNLTAIHAMSGRIADALDELERAIAGGYVDIGTLESSPFFRPLHAAPRFDAIVSDLRARVAGMRVRAEAAAARSTSPR